MRFNDVEIHTADGITSFVTSTTRIKSKEAPISSPSTKGPPDGTTFLNSSPLKLEDNELSRLNETKRAADAARKRNSILAYR